MLTQSCDRKAHDADPIGWAKTYTSKRDRTFRYSRNTGTSALRGHVDRLHLLEYVTLAEANGWPVWLESVKSAIARGYLLGEIRDALTNGGSLTSLPPRQLENSSADDATPQERSSIPRFSLEELHNHLVAFIVTDDQVYILLLARLVSNTCLTVS